MSLVSFNGKLSLSAHCYEDEKPKRRKKKRGKRGKK